MSAVPPPPHEASTAAALVAGLGAEGAELARPAPSVFHVNNKYSHRRPRLVCARRLPILRPRPFTRRGAGSQGRDRVRDRQSLRANQSPREAGGGTPRGGSPWIQVPLSQPGAGRKSDARPTDSPSRYITSARRDAGTRNVNSSDLKKKKKKSTPTRPAPNRKGRTQRLRGWAVAGRVGTSAGGWKEEYGCEGAEQLRLPGEPGPAREGAARRPRGAGSQDREPGVLLQEHSPEKGHREENWSMARVATRFLSRDAQSKARRPRGSPAKFTSRGAAVRPFVLPAAPAMVSPTLAPEGLGGRLLPSPRSSSMDIGRSRCGHGAGGGAGGHGDRRGIEPILAAADAGRETPEEPHRAAPRVLRGNLGIPFASSRGKPAGSTRTVQRPSP